MAYNGWLRFNGVEIANSSRMALLAPVLGIDTVRIRPSSVDWVRAAMGATEAQYKNPALTPWHDTDPVSDAFGGMVVLDVTGLNDNTGSATPIEYLGNGGNPGRLRDSTATLVVSAVLVGKTDASVEYGQQWMEKMLRGTPAAPSCEGADLEYFRYQGAGASSIVHRRNVKLTRGIVVTRERRTACATMRWVTFTLTAGDPFQYGLQQPQIQNLGGPNSGVTGTGIVLKGVINSTAWQSCPNYDYSPIQDPLNPSILPGPEIPEFYPAGWDFGPGTLVQRSYVYTSKLSPSMLDFVPMIELTTTVDARRLLVSVYPGDQTILDNCDPLFSVFISYLPAGGTMYVDGEQEAVYFWDGGSAAVRRADGVSFSPSAGPVDWKAYNHPLGLLTTLDIPWKAGSVLEGEGNVRVTTSVIPRA